MLLRRFMQHVRATLRTAREASTLHLTLVSGLEARANNLIDMLKGRD